MPARRGVNDPFFSGARGGVLAVGAGLYGPPGEMVITTLLW